MRGLLEVTLHPSLSASPPRDSQLGREAPTTGSRCTTFLKGLTRWSEAPTQNPESTNHNQLKDRFDLINQNNFNQEQGL